MKVNIICSGPSVEGLSSNRALLAGGPVVCVTRWRRFIDLIYPMEINYLFFSQSFAFKTHADNVLDYATETGGFLITSPDLVQSPDWEPVVNNFIKYGGVIVSKEARGESINHQERLTSLAATIFTFARMGFKHFDIFGADGGGGHDGQDLYYCQKKIDSDYHSISVARDNILADTERMNNYFWDEAEARELDITVTNWGDGNSLLDCFENRYYPNSNIDTISTSTDFI